MKIGAEATRNILYDEKIGGAIHIALGRSYPESDGLNVSAFHWDMMLFMQEQAQPSVAAAAGSHRPPAPTHHW